MDSRSTIYFLLLSLILSACGVQKNSTLKFRRTGHFEAAETKAVEQRQFNNAEIAMLSTEEQQNVILLPEDHLEQIEVPNPIEEQYRLSQKRQTGEVVSGDTLRKANQSFKHKNEIVITKKKGFYQLFLWLIVIATAILLFVGMVEGELMAGLFILLPILYGIFIQDPRDVMERLEKFKSSYLRLGTLYLIYSIGSVAIGVFLIINWENIGVFFLALAVLGVIAVVIAFRKRKQSVALAQLLNEPDASDRTEEITKKLFRLKLWKWIAIFGLLIPVAILFAIS